MKEEIDINGVKEKVLAEIGQHNGLSNKKLSQRLDTRKTTISWATKELKKEGLIRDTETLEGSSTNFVLKDGVKVERSYVLKELINNRALMHLYQALFIILYATVFLQMFVDMFGAIRGAVIGMLMIFFPSIILTLYDTLSSDDIEEITVWIDRAVQD